MRKTLVALVLLVTAATTVVAQIRYLERGQAWVARG